MSEKCIFEKYSALFAFSLISSRVHTRFKRVRDRTIRAKAGKRDTAKFYSFTFCKKEPSPVPFMFNYFKRRSFACRSLRGSKNVDQGPTRETAKQRSFASRRCSVEVLRRSARVILLARYAGYKSHRKYRLPAAIDLGESEQITEFPQSGEPIDKESSQEKGPEGSREYISHFFIVPQPSSVSSVLVPPSIYVLYRHGGT